jgi:hypothetical protein
MRTAGSHLAAFALGAAVGLIFLSSTTGPGDREAPRSQSQPDPAEEMRASGADRGSASQSTKRAAAPRHLESRPVLPPPTSAVRTAEDTLRATMQSFAGLTPDPTAVARNVENAILRSRRFQECGEQLVTRLNVPGRLVDLSIVLTGVVSNERMRLTEPEIGEEISAPVDADFRRCLAAALADEVVQCPGCRNAELNFEWPVQGGFNRPRPL